MHRKTDGIVLVVAFACALTVMAGCHAIGAVIANLFTARDVTIQAQVRVNKKDTLTIAVVSTLKGMRAEKAELARLVKRELDKHTRAVTTAAGKKASDLAAAGRLPAAADAAGTRYFVSCRIETLEAKPSKSVGFLRGRIEIVVDVYDTIEDTVVCSTSVSMRHPRKGELMSSEMTDEEMLVRLLRMSSLDIGRLFYKHKVPRGEIRNKALDAVG